MTDEDLYWVTTPLVTWGLLPFLAVNVGFWGSALPLEYILQRTMQAERRGKAGQAEGGWLDWSSWFATIEYDQSREDALAETREAVDVWTQAKGAAWLISGPTAMLGSAAGAFLFPAVMPAVTTAWPTLREFAVQMAIMELAGDFGLYWGHRIQHQSVYLWENFHSLHHTIRTPSPISTTFIDSTDATLQATLPLLVGAIVARAHPASFWVYCAVRVGENVLNHSGMESPLLSLLSLKCLPFRAGTAFHDQHHRYSNYAGNAKNFAEGFVFWDWAFGTASRPRARAAKACKD